MRDARKGVQPNLDSLDTVRGAGLGVIEPPESRRRRSPLFDRPLPSMPLIKMPANRPKSRVIIDFRERSFDTDFRLRTRKNSARKVGLIVECKPKTQPVGYSIRY